MFDYTSIGPHSAQKHDEDGNLLYYKLDGEGHETEEEITTNNGHPVMLTVSRAGTWEIKNVKITEK